MMVIFAQNLFDIRIQVRKPYLVNMNVRCQYKKRKLVAEKIKNFLMKDKTNLMLIGRYCANKS